MVYFSSNIRLALAEKGQYDLLKIITRYQRSATIVLSRPAARRRFGRTGAFLKDRVQFHLYFMILCTLHFLFFLYLLSRWILFLFSVHGYWSLFPRVQVLGLSALQHRLPSRYTLCIVIAFSLGWILAVLCLRMRRDFHLNGLFIFDGRGNRFPRSGGDHWLLRFGGIFYIVEFLSYFLI